MQEVDALLPTLVPRSRAISAAIRVREGVVLDGSFNLKTTDALNLHGDKPSVPAIEQVRQQLALRVAFNWQAGLRSAVRVHTTCANSARISFRCLESVPGNKGSLLFSAAIRM